ncbi:putative ABC transport system ATP-binding protein [Methanococcoides vulcani]|uniref:Putative ABC transport system ATP-binding protein n=1 Tax=Methanococcoides vulcani TaxID=1353158 RepID=A0A1H9YJ82_9EURY|nr:ATP-binding cassette domain-containing protein [Methanococcoides vulcani]SES69053.1 putative ABC transport system ATP-binding protein [Methanococcoides vulcani]
MSSELLNYKDISISYGEKKVLSHFDLDIKQGDRILLKGRSGAGKSTLLKMPMGFAHQTSGNLYFNNSLLDSNTVWDARKRIAYVSQDLDIYEGSVDEFIEEVFSYSFNEGKLDRTKLRRLLVYLGFEKDVLDMNFEELSGGEKQRIGIIMSVLIGKDIYLLDEITSSLDAALKEKVANYFLERKEWTLVIISHDDVWEKENVKVVPVGV